jgi:hypothetical protein
MSLPLRAFVQLAGRAQAVAGPNLGNLKFSTIDNLKFQKLQARTRAAFRKFEGEPGANPQDK